MWVSLKLSELEYYLSDAIPLSFTCIRYGKVKIVKGHLLTSTQNHMLKGIDNAPHSVRKKIMLLCFLATYIKD